MTTETVRAVRDHFSEYVDRAAREHERVVVTRNGRPEAVLIGYDDLVALEETLDVLSDPSAREEIAEARAEIARGDVVRGVDAVRALRPRS
jgi:antitoxin YefM